MRRTAPLALSLIALAFSNLAQATPPDFDAKVNKLAQQVMREQNIAGLAIGVTNHGEQHFYNFGVASKQSKQPVSSDTLFEIGSVSKTFTATLAGFAEASGKLKLQDSPTHYLKELRGSALDKVTLIQLATHVTGGFPLQLPDEVKTPNSSPTTTGPGSRSTPPTPSGRTPTPVSACSASPPRAPSMCRSRPRCSATSSPRWA